ncbi:MAG: carboxymuconolactone decarboxylase family protein [Chloroflexi bacterium]|nr:carboxymuconolactone decarboxylase family protein [Chloroflexota bacterium]
MTTSKELLAQGEQVRRRLAGGGEFRGSQPGSYDIAPGLGPLVTECLFGGIWARPQVDIKHRSLTTISALTVLGRGPQLKGHIRNGLNLGISTTEMVEALTHLLIYGGLPASLNALQLAREVFEEKPEWLASAPRELPTPRPATLEERIQRGNEIRRQLWGEGGVRWAAAAAVELAPEVIALLHGYFFGEIWARPGLDLKSRLVCALSALTVLGREPQLKNHIRAALHVGFTREQVVELLAHTTFYGGLPTALNALAAAKEVFDGAGG